MCAQDMPEGVVSGDDQLAAQDTVSVKRKQVLFPYHIFLHLQVFYATNTVSRRFWKPHDLAFQKRKLAAGFAGWRR